MQSVPVRMETSLQHNYKRLDGVINNEFEKTANKSQVCINIIFFMLLIIEKLVEHR